MLFLEAVLRRVRTGAPWRDLPADFRNWASQWWGSAGVRGPQRRSRSGGCARRRHDCPGSPESRWGKGGARRQAIGCSCGTPINPSSGSADQGDQEVAVSHLTVPPFPFPYTFRHSRFRRNDVGRRELKLGGVGMTGRGLTFHGERASHGEGWKVLTTGHIRFPSPRLPSPHQASHTRKPSPGEPLIRNSGSDNEDRGTGGRPGQSGWLPPATRTEPREQRGHHPPRAASLRQGSAYKWRRLMENCVARIKEYRGVAARKAASSFAANWKENRGFLTAG